MSQELHPQPCILRIGILGAAQIARKNMAAILHPTSNCIVTAIASRSLHKAEEIRQDVYNLLAGQPTQSKVSNWNELISSIAMFTGPDAYNLLLNDTKVPIDAVYIPLPTTLHKKFVLAAFAAGKHVLVEKPVAITITDYSEMLQSAYNLHGKYLMDGTMFVHHPRLESLHSYIYTTEKTSNDNIGTLTRINASFTFQGDGSFFQNNIRVSASGDPLGCIGDLGWYCVRLAVVLFDSVLAPMHEDTSSTTRTSRTVAHSAQVCHVQTNNEGVPLDATCIVTFRNSVACEPHYMGVLNREKVLSFHCSFLQPLTQLAQLCGTQRSVYMDDFVLSKRGPQVWKVHSQSKKCIDGKYEIVNEDTTMHVSMSDSFEQKEATIIPANDVNEVAQEVRMWRNFSRYCHAIENSTTLNDVTCKSSKIVGWGMDEISQEAKLSAETSFQTQIIMDALMESMRQNGKRVLITDICNFLPPWMY